MDLHIPSSLWGKTLGGRGWEVRASVASIFAYLSKGGRKIHAVPFGNRSRTSKKLGEKKQAQARIYLLISKRLIANDFLPIFPKGDGEGKKRLKVVRSASQGGREGTGFFGESSEGEVEKKGKRTLPEKSEKGKKVVRAAPLNFPLEGKHKEEAKGGKSR